MPIAAAGIPASGFGAPHIRQRLWFVADSEWGRREQRDERQRELLQPHKDSAPSRVGNTEREGLEGLTGSVHNGNKPRRLRAHEIGSTSSPSFVNGFWGNADWLWCRDDKYRPVEPGTFPLADGIAGRVGRLRGYGNAIVAPVAKEFIEAYLEAKGVNGFNS